MTTIPVRSNVSYLPRMFGFRRRRAVHIPDGKNETIAQDVVYDALMPLSSAAQTRVIEHVVAMLNERARALNDYEFEED
jgi:hypothetical protein